MVTEAAIRPGADLRGLRGLIAWGAPSSVVTILAPVFLESPSASWEWGLMFLLPGALVVAGAVWAISGLFIVLPLWFGLARLGLGRQLISWMLPIIGAVIVSAIWLWVGGMDSREPISMLRIAASGALSGALGGYGFCRGAMRS